MCPSDFHGSEGFTVRSGTLSAAHTQAVEVEVRCRACHERHPRRKPALLATIEGTRILVPYRMGANKARAGHVARTGMFWKAPAEDHGDVILRCRRCGTLCRVLRHALERAARSALLGATPAVLYASASTVTMASAAR